MHPTLILLITFGAVSLSIVIGWVTLYQLFFRYRLLVHERIREETVSDDPIGNLFNEANHWDDAPAGLVKRFIHWTKRIIEQSGVEIPAQNLLMLCCLTGFASGVLGAALARWFCVEPSQTLWWFGGVVVAAPGSMAPFLYILSRRSARLKKMARQLPEAFEMMSRTIRVGQTTTAAMQMIAEEFEAPISEEFQRCYQQQELGISQDVAMRSLAKRGGVVELQIFVMAMLVQSRCGGNLFQLLDKLASLVRSRMKMEMKVRALTGEGRMQAITLILLPIVALIAISILSPDYITVFYQRPWILGAVALSHATAALWIRSIIKIDA